MKIKDYNDKVVKETKLGEEAEIYNRNRSDKLEEGQFKEMSFKDKWYYFKDYYLNYVIGLLIFILVTTYVITSMIHSNNTKDTFFCAMMEGVQLDEETTKALPESFCSYLTDQTDYKGYINAKHTTFSTFYTTIPDDIRLDGFYDQNKIDIFILRPESFTAYVANGSILDLSTVLSEEQLEALDSRIVFVIDPDTKEEMPYGILLDDISYQFQEGTGEKMAPPILTIATCTKRKKVAAYFIDFILQEI